MTHPADLSSPHRPVAQTEEDGAASVLQTGAGKTTETIISPQDRSKAPPPKSQSQQQPSVSQGKDVIMFETFYSQTTNVAPPYDDDIEQSGKSKLIAFYENLQVFFFLLQL